MSTPIEMTGDLAVFGGKKSVESVLIFDMFQRWFRVLFLLNHITYMYVA